jgi:nicotinamidase-related amidase
VRSVIDTRTFLKEGRTALVVIDLQRGIVARDVAPHRSADVVANAAKVAHAFRTAELPLVWVHVSYAAKRDDMLKPIVDEAPASTPPSPGWAEFMPELGVQQDDVIVTKRNWGAFYGTDLDLQLRRRQVTQIALCGIATNLGVESTARDAFERNYKLLFVEDAMAAMSAQEHEHSCTRIFPRMGIVRATSQVLDALRSPL